MEVEAQQEHKWLHKLAGEWKATGSACMSPDQPEQSWEGTETVRLLGDVWTIAESHGDAPGGGTARTMMTLGYDPQKQRFVGTFVGSMMTNMWIYEGELDSAGKVLTLNTEGPSLAGEGKLAKYKDVIELINDNERVMTSESLGEDGQWIKFMTMKYTRAK